MINCQLLLSTASCFAFNCQLLLSAANCCLQLPTVAFNLNLRHYSTATAGVLCLADPALAAAAAVAPAAAPAAPWYMLALGKAVQVEPMKPATLLLLKAHDTLEANP